MCGDDYQIKLLGKRFMGYCGLAEGVELFSLAEISLNFSFWIWLIFVAYLRVSLGSLDA